MGFWFSQYQQTRLNPNYRYGFIGGAHSVDPPSEPPWPSDDELDFSSSSFPFSSPPYLFLQQPRSSL